MIRQMFLNERLDNLAKLFDGVKFIGESKFDFDITAIAFAAFVTVGGFEKIFGVVFRPFRQVMRVEDTAAAMGKRIFSVDVFKV